MKDENEMKGKGKEKSLKRREKKERKKEKERSKVRERRRRRRRGGGGQKKTAGKREIKRSGLKGMRKGLVDVVDTKTEFLMMGRKMMTKDEKREKSFNGRKKMKINESDDNIQEFDKRFESNIVVLNGDDDIKIERSEIMKSGRKEKSKMMIKSEMN